MSKSNESGDGTDMNGNDVKQELYEVRYIFQEAMEDKIYYIVARSLVTAIERFYQLRPNNKIRRVRLLAERDLGSLSMKTNLAVCGE